ncbi:FAD-dependent oxidoreductase, partial [Streptomyces shenzhenensis]|uniref:FAD-dependent oxidoreductase n=1 Tax=Streptomyces shenzhenensis TaxID=943815 RepID=UPI0015F0E5FE
MTVVVVGAGILGASVAYHLACRDAPVTLIGRGPGPAAGATAGSFAWIGGSRLRHPHRRVL